MPNKGKDQNTMGRRGPLLEAKRQPSRQVERALRTRKKAFEMLSAGGTYPKEGLLIEKEKSIREANRMITGTVLSSVKNAIKYLNKQRT